MKKISLSLHQILKTIFLLMLGIEVFIVLSDIFLNEWKWIDSSSLRRSFNITREDSIANWFSSMQAMLVALVLFAIAAFEKKGKRVGWMILGSIFMLISVDDGAKLHERIGGVFKDSLLEAHPDSFVGSSYGWQVILGPFMLLVAIYMAWFLWKELKKSHLFSFFVAALVIMAIAISLDYVEGMDLPGMMSQNFKHTLKVIEEFMEMFATTILLVLFLKVFFLRNKSFQLHISN